MYKFREDGEEAGPDAGLEPRVVMDFRAPLLIGHERRKHALSRRGESLTYWKPILTKEHSTVHNLPWIPTEHFCAELLLE